MEDFKSLHCHCHEGICKPSERVRHGNGNSRLSHIIVFAAFSCETGHLLLMLRELTLTRSLAALGFGSLETIVQKLFTCLPMSVIYMPRLAASDELEISIALESRDHAHPFHSAERVKNFLLMWLPRLCHGVSVKRREIEVKELFTWSSTMAKQPPAEARDCDARWTRPRSYLDASERHKIPCAWLAQRF